MDTSTLAGQVTDLAHSTGNVKKLRNLILEIAMRGNLVEQDFTDEPVREVIKRLNISAQSVVKTSNKYIKRQMSSTYEIDVPYTLPPGWEWMTSGQIASSIQYGFTASADPNIVSPKLVRITDIQDNCVDWDTVPGCYIEEDKIAQYELRSGDILIARTGGTIGKSYLLESVNLKAVFASYLIRIRFLGILTPLYAKYFLASPLYWKQLTEKSKGTGQPNVNGTSLSELIIPIPPLAEQHRIVARIDELMQLCDQLEEQLLQCDQLQIQTTKSTLFHLTDAPTKSAARPYWQLAEKHFGEFFDRPSTIEDLRSAILQFAVQGRLVPQDPNGEIPTNLQGFRQVIDSEKFDLPAGWQVVRIGDIADVKGGKRLPAGHNVQDVVTPYAYIRVTDMKNGTIRSVGLKYITDETRKLIARYTISSDDLYITIAGTIGEVGIVPAEFDGMNLTENAAKISLHDQKITDKSYILLALRSQSTQLQFQALFKQMAQPKLSLQNIRSTYLFIPPYDEQKRIVTKVTELMQLCGQLETESTYRRELSGILFDSIVHHMFEATV